MELDEKPNIEIQDNTTHDQYEHNEEEAEVLEEYEFENVLPNISKIESLASTSNAVDPDERFLLSCLPILQRLTNKKNVLAKIKIQTLLYELEYDEKYSG